ncbi:MAG: LamG domain-containing protein [Myxococcales bacterium]|nr:LamG domain-containing protein [Myxococcales bacterium]
MVLVRRLAVITALSGACACSLISGAADLEVAPDDPSDASSAPPETSTPPPRGVDSGGVDFDDAAADATSEDGGSAPACGNDPSLVLYMRFDEPIGSPGAQHCAPGLVGRLTDGAAFVAAGKVGGAVDTTGGYVDLAVPPALAITGALTVAAWIRPAVLPTTGADYVFGRRGATAGPGYRLGLRPQGVTFIAVTDQSMSAEAVGPTVPVGQWTHIAGVYAPGVAARVYVGGKLEKDQQATNIAALGGLGLPTRVGIRGDGDPATNFRGAVDELRVYKRALDAAEIAALATP